MLSVEPGLDAGVAQTLPNLRHRRFVGTVVAEKDVESVLGVTVFRHRMGIVPRCGLGQTRQAARASMTSEIDVGAKRAKEVIVVQTIELHLQQETLDRARRLARARHCRIEDVIQAAIEGLPIVEPQEDLILGMFKDEPELIDQVTQLAMEARERDPLRRESA